MRAGAKRQQPAISIGGDVEVLVAFPVPSLGADGDDRAGREDHAVVLDVLEADPRRERRDGLDAQDLGDRRGHELRRPRNQLPLVGLDGEQMHAVGQLALGRVDGPGEHVHRQVHALGVRQPIALGLRSLHGVMAGLQAAAAGDAHGLERGKRGLERRHVAEMGAVSAHMRHDVGKADSILPRSVLNARMSNCFCTQVDHSCSRGASSAGAPRMAAIVSAGYRLANAPTNSA